MLLHPFYTFGLSMSHCCVSRGVSGGSKKFLKGGTEDNLSTPSSFIANVHNEIYAVYKEKAALKKLRQ